MDKTIITGTIPELREAINFGKEFLEDCRAAGSQPNWSTVDRLLDLYEQLVQAISLGEEV